MAQTPETVQESNSRSGPTGWVGTHWVGLDLIFGGSPKYDKKNQALMAQSPFKNRALELLIILQIAARSPLTILQGTELLPLQTPINI